MNLRLNQYFDDDPSMLATSDDVPLFRQRLPWRIPFSSPLPSPSDNSVRIDFANASPINSSPSRMRITDDLSAGIRRIPGTGKAANIESCHHLPERYKQQQRQTSRLQSGAASAWNLKDVVWTGSRPHVIFARPVRSSATANYHALIVSGRNEPTHAPSQHREREVKERRGHRLLEILLLAISR